MEINIFEKIADHYHNKTLSIKEWAAECGNGNKKLDEIQVFLLYLKNKKVKLKNVDSFEKNFKYKEDEVTEPGDLEYLGSKYQITHGNTQQYEIFMKERLRTFPKAQILAARDVISEDFLFLGLKEKLDEKEKLATKNIILLIRIDRRSLADLNYLPHAKHVTNWKDVILVFNDANISIKN